MRVFKCDRCGTYYDEWVDIDNQPFIVKIHSTDKDRFNLADLCVPCYNELVKFMRNDTYCFHSKELDFIQPKIEIIDKYKEEEAKE